MKSFKQYITELYDDQSDLDKEVYDFHKDNTVKKNHPVADINFEVKPGKDKSRKADQETDTEYKKLNSSKTMKSTDIYKFKKFTKESEELDEVSKERLKKYISKGYESNFKKDPTPRDHFARRSPDIEKRKKYMSMAYKKLTFPKSVKVAATESENLDENTISAKAGREGKDLGKPGKNFSKIADKAGKAYGSKEAGERVAGAILAKMRAKRG